MKAMVLKEYNQPLVYCEDYPDPVIREENDVIIKITACGLCTTDIKVQHGVLDCRGSSAMNRRASLRRSAAE